MSAEKPKQKNRDLFLKASYGIIKRLFIYHEQKKKRDADVKETYNYSDIKQNMAYINRLKHLLESDIGYEIRDIKGKVVDKFVPKAEVKYPLYFMASCIKSTNVVVVYKRRSLH